MDAIDLVAEQRILAAQARGEFDHLPLAGRPLPPDDLADLPAEIRVACRVLRSAGVLPEGPVRATALGSLVAAAAGADEEAPAASRGASLRLELLLERRGSAVPPEYHARAAARIAGANDRSSARPRPGALP